MDYRIELIIMPVSDVDSVARLLRRHARLAGRPRPDRRREHPLRPGHAARLGLLDRLRPRPHRDASRAACGAIQVVVGSADEALADLTARGVAADGVDDQPWGRFVTFADPDGNSWTLQELPDWSQRRSHAGSRSQRPGGVPPPRRHPTGTGGLIASCDVRQS